MKLPSENFTGPLLQLIVNLSIDERRKQGAVYPPDAWRHVFREASRHRPSRQIVAAIRAMTRLENQNREKNGANA